MPSSYHPRECVEWPFPKREHPLDEIAASKMPGQDEAFRSMMRVQNRLLVFNLWGVDMAKFSTKESPAVRRQKIKGRVFDELAAKVARLTGRPLAFGLALIVIVLWGVTGPIFNYSDTWQLIINTGTTIVTFLMVFLIQNSQNRDSAAIQVKLDELIRVGDVKNDFVGIEHLTEEEIEELREKCERAAQRHLSNTNRH
jgi:low affinity Fe/Cu permease